VPFDRLGGWGAAFTVPLELEPELDLPEERGVVVVVAPELPAFGAAPVFGAVAAAAPVPSDPDVSVTVVLAAVVCGRASRTTNRPVAPAAAATIQRVMRVTRLR